MLWRAVVKFNLLTLSSGFTGRMRFAWGGNRSFMFEFFLIRRKTYSYCYHVHPYNKKTKDRKMHCFRKKITCLKSSMTCNSSSFSSSAEKLPFLRLVSSSMSSFKKTYLCKIPIKSNHFFNKTQKQTFTLELRRPMCCCFDLIGFFYSLRQKNSPLSEIKWQNAQ